MASNKQRTLITIVSLLILLNCIFLQSIKAETYVDQIAGLGVITNLFEKREYNAVVAEGERLLKEIAEIDASIAVEGTTFLSTIPGMFSEDISVVLAPLVFLSPPGWILLGTGLAGDVMDTAQKNSSAWKELYTKQNENPLQKYLSISQQRSLFKQLGISYYHLEKHALAAQFLSRYLDIEETFRLTIARQDRREGYISTYYEDVEFLVESLVKIGKYEEAISYIEVSKAKTLSEYILGSYYARKNNKFLRQLKISRAQFESNAAGTRGTIANNTLEETQNRAIKLSRKIQKQGRGKTFLLLKGLSIEKPRKEDFLTFDNGTAFLSYYVGKKTIFVGLYIGDSGFHCEIINVEGRDLKLKIDTFTAQARVNYDNTLASARELGEILLNPILDRLKENKIRTIIISGHDFLYNLSFSGLRPENDFLINEYDIGYISSLTTLKLQKEIQTKYQKNQLKTLENNAGFALLVGNVNNTRFDVEELPWTGVELKDVASSLANNKHTVEVLSRDKATEKSVIEKMAGAKIIHFATHSVFDQDNPEKSWILLADDNLDDGLLEAHEIYSKISSFQNLDLVFLSSCRSGLAGILPGSDPYGLNRSFTMLGAKHVVDTTWPISDRQASSIAKEFYEKYAKTGSILRGFNQALRKYAESDDLSWAAYKISGLTQ